MLIHRIPDTAPTTTPATRADSNGWFSTAALLRSIQLAAWDADSATATVVAALHRAAQPPTAGKVFEVAA